MKWEDRLDVSGFSDVGMRRSNNQDSFKVVVASSVQQWRSRGHVMVVADGMGAHAVGELASKMAVDSIPHAYHKLAHLPCSQAIVKAVQDANTLIHNRGTANREFQGMGTTCTALVLLPEGAMIAHVGDSRAYRIRGDRIEQLSFDHSLAWELIRRKQLTPDQARTMVPNNVITRSLGPEAHVEVDVEGPHAVLPGDVFVLCSDGLSGQVGDSDIGLIARHVSAEEACRYLVDMANLRGGPDNITVVVVRIEDPSHSDAAIAISSDKPPGRVLDTATLCVALGGAGVATAALLGALQLFVSGIAGPIVTGLTAGVGAAGLILGSVGAVWRHLTRARNMPETQAQATAYRQAQCTLNKAALERFGQRLQQQRSIAVDQAWNVDWTEFFSHRNAADQRAAAGDYIAALRAFCLAQHLLSLGQKRYQEQTQALLGGS